MNKIWTEEEEAQRLHDRFAALKASGGIGQAKFARMHKVPGGASMVSQHIKGRRPINLASATAYANGFGCRLDEISPRLAKMASDAAAVSRYEGKQVIALHAEDELPNGIVCIKETSVKFAAGNGHIAHFDEIEQSVPASYRLEWFQREGISPEKAKRFKVKGDSMESLLFDGDTVLVNLSQTVITDGKVYAIRYGDDLRIKRIYKRLDGGLILHSDNPNHLPRDEELTPEMADEHITIIGQVRDKSGKGGL